MSEDGKSQPETINHSGEDWHYTVDGDEEYCFASHRESDPYGHTREVVYNSTYEQVEIRYASNERAPFVVSQVGAPVEVVAEVLRKMGWTVTAPKEE